MLKKNFFDKSVFFWLSKILYKGGNYFPQKKLMIIIKKNSHLIF